MLYDIGFSTSFDSKPYRYIPWVQETQNEYSRLPKDWGKIDFPQKESETKEKTLNRYYLNELTGDEGRIVFKDDCLLEVELSKEDGLFFFQNMKFNIFGSGFTKEEALKDFSEFFIHDYFSYKNTPPEGLTQDARQLLAEYESVISTFESA
jgi:hypothetical protein